MVVNVTAKNVEVKVAHPGRRTFPRQVVLVEVDHQVDPEEVLGT